MDSSQLHKEEHQVTAKTQAPPHASQQTWRPLQLLNYYRLTLSSIIALLTISHVDLKPLGGHNYSLFKAIALVYFGVCILNYFTIKKRQPAFHIQVYSHIIIDITAITLLMHASGGVKSGLGVLLIVAIAGGSLLMAGRTAIFFAAVASLAVLIEQVYNGFEAFDTTASYTQAGLLGVTLFGTAILAYTLAQRLRESEALAERRGIDLANMAQLTEYIIQRMQTGILVIDRNSTIHLINESARHLLGLQPTSPVTRLDEASQRLAEHVEKWWQQPNYRAPILRANEPAPEIQPRFAQLGLDDNSGTLIFIEDTAAMSQQAQQLKLASLGQLTASIAHEIRNPLGAISHAGQLLAESPQLNSEDTRLTEIIRQHSQRVNTIIENIMQLSRRERSQPEEFELKPWLEKFIVDFSHSTAENADNLNMEISPNNLMVRIDPSQLQQILANLCINGLRHGMSQNNPRLDLKAGISEDAHKPYLEVHDHGPGIDAETAQHLFEPFFTTQETGTGLGLYISNELCACNQARLDFIPQTETGACFRITFADPRRRQVF